jgi:hypothetical protein
MDKFGTQELRKMEKEDRMNRINRMKKRTGAGETKRHGWEK